MLNGWYRLLIAATFAAASNSAAEAFAAPEFLPAEPQFASPRGCTAVDHRGEMGRPLSQGDTNFCFAYSSADLIRQRTGQSVSPLDLATGYYFTDARLVSRVSSPLMREYLRAHPNLIAKVAAERADLYVTPTAGRDLPMFHKLGGGLEVTTILMANAEGLCANEDYESDLGLASFLPQIEKWEADALAGASSIGPEVAVLEAPFRGPEADRFNTAWLHERESRCRSRKVPAVPLIPVEFELAADLETFKALEAAQSLTSGAKQSILATLDFALDHGRVVSIGYDLNTLLRVPLPADESDHASAVVARRPGANGCEYLVRDPSGFPCEALRDPFVTRCQDREIWVREDELSPSLYSTVYLR